MNFFCVFVSILIFEKKQYVPVPDARRATRFTRPKRTVLRETTERRTWFHVALPSGIQGKQRAYVHSDGIQGKRRASSGIQRQRRAYIGT
jgi:hypothetical protein